MANSLETIYRNGPLLNANTTPSTRNLPYGGGEYTLWTPNMNPPQAPVPAQVPYTPPQSQGYSQTPVPVKQNQQMNKYINPATGQQYTPAEYAAKIRNSLPIGQNNGDIPKYSGDAMMNPDESAAGLSTRASSLNNARNDIATGTTDPYDITKGGKIVYSPAEKAAIEKAYAGIYDPALNDVFARLKTREQEAAAALDQKNKLEQMARQHEYSMLEKGLTSSGTSPSGAYVKGANPAVDAWAQRIFDGSAKITDIPASQKGMRDAVTIALMDSGNTLSGKPTVTELGKAAKTEAESIMADFKARKGTDAVGRSRLWGGGAIRAAIPGTESYDFKNSVSNLVSQLSLDGVKYLKGQGQVSDAERALLANAVTKLKLSQSESEFEETLQGIIDRLSGGSSETLTSPDGTQEVNVSELTPEQLQEATNAGWY